MPSKLCDTVPAWAHLQGTESLRRGSTGRMSLLALVLAAAGIPGWSSTACAVQANVDTTTVLNTVSDIGLGLHTSVYANQFDHPALPGLIDASGVQQLRFPGGNYADIYQWSTHHAINGYAANGSDFGNFVNVLDDSSSKGMVTVNYGSSHQGTMGGQPKEAAAWVAYANADASIYGTGNDIPIGVDEEGNDWRTAGYWAKLRASTVSEYQSWAGGDYDSDYNFLAINHDDPVGIEQWEIGNELNGNGYYATYWDWQYDLHAPYDGNRVGNPALSPTAYGQNLIEFSQAMKAVDPTIQIGAVLVGTGAGNVSNPSTNWDLNVMQTADGYFDFGIYHWYVDNGTEWDVLLNAVDDLEGEFQLLRDRLDQYTTAGSEEIDLHMTEFGFFGTVPNATYAAMFDADTYATALAEGMQSVHYLEMSKDGYLGDAFVPQEGEAYYAIQMVDHLIDPGDLFVATTSDDSTVKVHAARSGTDSVAVMLINEGNDADVSINIDGLELVGTAQLWEYGWDEVNGDDPPTMQVLSGLTNGFIVTVPDRTIVTLVIPTIPTVTLPGDYNNDGVVNAADYTVWRNAKGTSALLPNDATPGTVDQSDYTVWRDNYGQSLGSGSAAGVPEPSAGFLAWLAAASLFVLVRRRG